MLLASVLTFAALTAGFARAGDAELSRFRTEYPKALETLERAYSDCHGECRLIGPAGQNDFRLVKDEVRFASSGGNRKVAIKAAPRPDVKTYPHEKVFSYGEGWAFSLAKTPDRPAFDVSAINAVERTKADYDSAVGRSLSAPFSAFLLPMSRVMGLPTYRLRAAESFNRAGKSLIRVHLTFGSLETPQRVVLELDPSASWAIVRSEFYWKDTPGSARVTADIEYGPQVDGIPTPKSVKITDTSLMKGTPPKQYEFRQFQFGPTPLEEFKLPYHGLPDVTATPSRGVFDSPTFWLLALGSAGIGLGLVLREVSRRSRLAAA